MRALIAAVLGSILVSGCGGGGGGSSSPPPSQPPTPQSQTISFATAGPIYKYLSNPAFTNAAQGGNGTGAITYSTDNAAVATVNTNSGLVVVMSVGTARITANKAADTNFLAATASYELRVAPREVQLTAWVGASDTAVQFSAPSDSLNFVRSSDLRCDPANLTQCADAAETIIASPTMVDTTARLNRPAAYWLKHGPNVTSTIVAPETKFERALTANLVVFGQKLWQLTGTGSTANEIWSSGDGFNWQLESANVPAQLDSRLLVLDNALWLVSVNYYSNPLLPIQVWRSTDGRTWTEVAQNNSFPKRGYFGATVFNGRLWVVGGWDGVDHNDVWSSADGANWTQATAAAQFAPREQHELVAYGGRLWVIGGYRMGQTYADVWSSADGVTWQEETASAAFGPRFSHRVVATGTKMWLIAGQNEYQLAQRDVWSSTDGRNWTQVTDHAAFSPRGNHGAVAWNGQLWVIGPGDNDVWTSATEGPPTWWKTTRSAAIPGKTAVSAAVFRGHLHVLDDELHLWSSPDGMSWAEETNRVPGFSPVFGWPGAQLLASGNRLLLVGGLQFSPGPVYFREIWETTNGQNWTRIVDAVPFSAEAFTQVIEFDGKYWAFAGTSADSYDAEIWSSTNAVDWTRVVQNPPYGPRAAHRVLAYNNRLWVIAGARPGVSGTYGSDVWSSDDGLNWIQSGGPNTGLPARVFGAGVALDQKMCVYGGGLPFASDAWCSANGSTWEQVSDDAPLGPVVTHNGAVFMFGSSATRPNSTDLVWRSSDGVAWRLGYRNTMRFPLLSP